MKIQKNLGRIVGKILTQNYRKSQYKISENFLKTINKYKGRLSHQNGVSKGSLEGGFEGKL